MSLLQFVQPTKVIKFYSTIKTCISIKMANFVLSFYLVNPKLKHEIWLGRSFMSHLPRINIFRMTCGSFMYFLLSHCLMFARGAFLQIVLKQNKIQRESRKGESQRKYTTISKIKPMTYCFCQAPIL